MTGPPGGPVCQPGVQVGDLGGATILGIGILAALFDAARSGTGSRVEVAMYDAAMAWTSIHAGEYWASGVAPDPGAMLLNGKWPCYQVYRCADDRFLSVGLSRRSSGRTSAGSSNGPTSSSGSSTPTPGPSWPS